MAEWFCHHCRRWVNGARCKLCHTLMDPGPMGFTAAEQESIAAGEQDG